MYQYEMGWDGMACVVVWLSSPRIYSKSERSEINPSGALAGVFSMNYLQLTSRNDNIRL